MGSMSIRFRLSASLLAALALGPFLGAQDPDASEKTVLPAGKSEVGAKLFVEKGCHQCHSAGTTKLPPVELAPASSSNSEAISTPSGPATTTPRAIMDPNHLVSEDYRVAMMRLGDNFKAENSPMPSFVDLLRVSDLVHLAAFLDSLTH